MTGAPELPENPPGGLAGPPVGGAPANGSAGRADGHRHDDTERLQAAPSAVLDEAHIGDIEGALGRIRIGEQQDQPRGHRRRPVIFLAIFGPGLIVMVGDNDAGGVATHAQAGQNYAYSMMWVLLLLMPVLIVNLEMVVRLGAVTGVGHARLINERFGRFWGWFSVGDLFLLNFLTITTEFIGVSLALAYFGISKYIALPLAAATLIVITTSGSFRRWESAMLLFIASSVVLFPQRPGSPRPLGQPRLAQHRRHHHHRCPPHALRHADGRHAVPAPQRRPHGDLAVRRAFVSNHNPARPQRRSARPCMQERYSIRAGHGEQRASAGRPVKAGRPGATGRSTICRTLGCCDCCLEGVIAAGDVCL